MRAKGGCWVDSWKAQQAQESMYDFLWIDALFATLLWLYNRLLCVHFGLCSARSREAEGVILRMTSIHAIVWSGLAAGAHDRVGCDRVVADVCCRRPTVIRGCGISRMVCGPDVVFPVLSVCDVN